MVCIGWAGRVGSGAEPLVGSAHDLFRQQAREFLAACAGQPDCLCRSDDALHTLRVNMAALESAGQRRIAIDPGG